MQNIEPIIDQHTSSSKQSVVSQGKRPEIPPVLDAMKAAGSAEEAFNVLYEWATNKVVQCEGELYDVEEEMERGGFELVRKLLEEHVRSRGVGNVGPSLIAEKRPLAAISEDVQAQSSSNEDVKHKEQRPKAEHPAANTEATRLSYRRIHNRKYESVFGTIDIARLGYGRPGHASVHPLDDQLNLPVRRYSYILQKRGAKLVARGPYDEALDSISDFTAAHLPRRQLEEIVQEAAEDFDCFYETRCRELPSPCETGPILVAGVDCKGIPRRRTEEEKNDPQHKRLEPGEKKTKKKMATVASVHTTTPHYRTAEDVVENLMDPETAKVKSNKERKRPKSEDRRIWASVLQSKDDVIQQVAEEMVKRDPEREKIAVCLTDGERALEQRAIKYLKAAFGDLTLILDIIHVLEYLWDAAHVFFDVGSEDARQWVRERLLAILQGRVCTVVAGMRQSATKLGYSEKQREPVDKACNYYLHNKHRMQYDVYLTQGLPIASGSVEGACGHLVKDRMELTGALWNVYDKSADAVLKMRALDKSGDFDAYWDFRMGQEHARVYRQEVYAAAA